MLRVQEVNTYYGKSHVLKDLSFTLAQGEVVAILARNGAGKTTTLKTIMGLLHPKSGSITLDGRDITRVAPHLIPRLGVGYMPQGRGLFRELTVYENLKVALVGSGRSPESLEASFHLFPILKERLRQVAGTLSGGEQQMLAFARAFCTKPRLLLMDEPTEGLMPTAVGKVKDTIKAINASGVSILLVEQRIDVALDVAHRILMMENGSLKHEGKPEDLRKDRTVVLKYLGVKA